MRNFRGCPDCGHVHGKGWCPAKEEARKRPGYRPEVHSPKPALQLQQMASQSGPQRG